MDGMTSIKKYRSVVKVKNGGFKLLHKIHNVDKIGNVF